MIEGLQLTIPRRMRLVKVTLVISLMLSMCLSFNLWGGQRYFPYTPLIETEQLRPPFDYIFLAITLLFLIASLIMRFQRLFLFLAFATCVWLALADITRVQPWFYIYNSLLAVFIFYNGRVDDPNKYTSFFIILQIIVASVYFFTGLSQFNDFFIKKEFVTVIAPLRQMVSERQFNLFVKTGYIVPYILIFIGVGLMINAIRYLAITLAVIMHFFLIVFLFPSANNSNYAFWLSNLTFILLVFLLFSGKTKQRYFSPVFLFQMPLFYMVFALFVVMPFFNRTGKWPDFLSSNFRNGNAKEAAFIISNDLYSALPLYERHFYTFSGTGYRLDHNRWCREELNADCFPDAKVYTSIQRYLLSFRKGDVKEIELQDGSENTLLRKP